MNVPFGDLKRQQNQLRQEIEEAIGRVLSSGYYILGPETQRFEKEFASYCGVKECVGVANGTEAIYLALTALGIGSGDEVITVANAAVYETLTILQTGAIPVFVDVDPQSYNLDPTKLEAAITKNTKAIIPVHLYGRMAALEDILAIARQHGIAVIEDCAQAHGAIMNGRPAGSIGLCGCFSFYPTKNLGAVGDGGAIVTNDSTLADGLRRLRQYGWERKYYTSDLGGLNSRLDELQSAILSVKLRYLPNWNMRRCEIANMYNRLLGDADIIRPPKANDGEHVYHLYVIRSKQRDALQMHLRSLGIGTDIHYPLPAYQQPVYLHLAPKGGLLYTDQLAGEILSLPNFPELSDDEVQIVANGILSFV